MLQDTALKQHFRRSRSLLLIIALSGSGAVMGLLAGSEPLLALVVAAATLLAVTTFAWPDVATLVVVFILYTNAAVVAVRFHGVPFLVSTLVPALLIIPLTNYLIFRRQKPVITSVLPLIFLFLAIQVLGTIFSRNIDISVSALATFVAEGFGLYILIINVIRTPATLRRVTWVLLIAGAFMGGLSFYQYITGTYDNNYGGFAQVSNTAFGTGVETLLGEATQPRLEGPLNEKNYYAQIMLMLVPLGLFRFWGERNNLLRILAIPATCLIAIGMALTFSRGAAVGFVLTLLVMVFMRYIKPYQLIVILLGLVLLLLQAVPEYGMRLTSLQALSEITEEGSSGFAAADRATQSRVTEMLAAGLVFADYPVIGVGPGMFNYYYRDYAEKVGFRVTGETRAAHNMYLEIAANHGALGLICLLAILFVTLRNLAHARKHAMQSHAGLAHIVTGIMLAIIAYMTTSLFLSLAYERYFWLMLALGGAASHIATRETLAGAQPTGKRVGDD